ncbi:MAG: hypothetical protein AB2689_28100 [Candidatus Thiodiazotropha taylori]
MSDQSHVYKYTTYASVAFIIIISIAFGVTIYQLQVGIKQTVDNQLKDVREELNKTISKSTSRELSDVIKVVNSELENRIETIAEFFPSGALMAFDRQECPEGWEKFEQASGRVIVASGRGRGLNNRSLGEMGGEEVHTLTAAEMPAHSHKYTDHYVAHNPKDRYEGLRGAEWYGSGNPGFGRLHPSTSAVGGNKAHNNMQPYYVATLCRKT